MSQAATRSAVARTFHTKRSMDATLSCTPPFEQPDNKYSCQARVSCSRCYHGTLTGQGRLQAARSDKFRCVMQDRQ